MEYKERFSIQQANKFLKWNSVVLNKNSSTTSNFKLILSERKTLFNVLTVKVHGFWDIVMKAVFHKLVSNFDHFFLLCSFIIFSLWFFIFLMGFFCCFAVVWFDCWVFVWLVLWGFCWFGFFGRGQREVLFFFYFLLAFHYSKDQKHYHCSKNVGMIKNVVENAGFRLI